MRQHLQNVIEDVREELFATGSCFFFSSQNTDRYFSFSELLYFWSLKDIKETLQLKSNDMISKKISAEIKNAAEKLCDFDLVILS